MKALAYNGKGDMRCDTVPDPKIEHPRDAIIKVTACAICGLNLHFDGVIPGMERGDILAMRVGAKWAKSAGRTKHWRLATKYALHHLLRRMLLLQARLFLRLRAHEKAEKLWGHSPAGLFGYSHLLGGYAGGQAEYLRALCRCRAT